MSLNTFSDPSLVSITGGVSITKDLQNGTAANLSVGGSITSTGAIVGATGLSITAGGETITAGGLSITAGGATVTGGVVTDTLAGGQGALQTITDSGTLTIASLRAIRATVAAGATATAIVIPTGTAPGQEVSIMNENATGASTLIIATNVSANVTISGLQGARLVWNSGLAKWVKC